jgi:hypothetical protein
MKKKKKGTYECTVTHRQLIDRIRSVELPKPIKQEFLVVYTRWLQNSGPSWTVERLKTFKQSLLKEVAEGLSSSLYPWFKKSASGNLLGVMGKLRRLATTGHLRQVLDIVNVYTSWKRITLNTEEIKDIQKTIEAQPVSEPYWRSLERRMPHVLKYLGINRCLSCVWPTPILQTGVSPSQMRRLADDIRNITLPEWCQEDYDHLLERALGGEIHTPQGIDKSFGLINGKIQITPNPGLKTRYYAVPNLLIQRALDPLKEGLLSILPKLPWDCTLDQGKADHAILRHLKRGEKAFSVDLSSATDHFPWSWQKRILFRLVKPFGAAKLMRDLFTACVEEGVWELDVSRANPKDHTRYQAVWSKGQPLGLGPSFPLFTLSHGILLLILSNRQWEGKFFVLGDDVIILDEMLYTQYTSALEKAQVPISQGKSYASNRLATFAGKVYTPKGYWYNPKWCQINQRNFLDVASYWPYWANMTTVPEKELIRKVLSLPEPYGLGHNPDGLTLDQRMTSDVVERIESLRDRKFVPARYSVPSWQTIRTLRWEDRKYILDNIKIRTDFKVHRRQTSFGDEVLELFYNSANPDFPMGTTPRMNPWSIGRAPFWRQVFRNG